MGATVIYLGDGEVGEAVVYGLPFIVGVPTELPDGFEWAHKIVNNSTFAVVPDAPAPDPVAAPAPKRKGRPPRAR
jgi:hypothetical protein